MSMNINRKIEKKLRITFVYLYTFSSVSQLSEWKKERKVRLQYETCRLLFSISEASWFWSSYICPHIPTCDFPSIYIKQKNKELKRERKQLHSLPEKKVNLSFLILKIFNYWDVYVPICKPTNSKTGGKK